MLISLTEMNDEARPMGTVMVSLTEIASICAYRYHSFRPPCGCKLRLRNGDTLLVHESIEEIAKIVESTPKE